MSELDLMGKQGNITVDSFDIKSEAERNKIAKYSCFCLKKSNLEVLRP